MMIRTCLLMGVLAVGLTVLPSDGHGFDGRQFAGPCAAPGTAQGTAPCRIAQALPAEKIAMPVGMMPPLPLPRPSGLGQPVRHAPACLCDHPDDDR